MRRLTGRLKLAALTNTKFMLLVDHHQSQLRELDTFLYQGLRSDDEFRSPLGNLLPPSATPHK